MKNSTIKSKQATEQLRVTPQEHALAKRFAAERKLTMPEAVRDLFAIATKAMKNGAKRAKRA